METKCYFAVGFVVRLMLIFYGAIHDLWLRVPFTDVDYHVFTDAARLVYEGGSPYSRATYRYPPLIAWMLVPNCFLTIWGKLFFTSLDLLVAWLVLIVVGTQTKNQAVAKRCALLWLLNPVSIIISARGNSDGLIAAVVLLCLTTAIRNQPSLSGVTLALAIHIRLYPLVFSLPVYLSFRKEATSGERGQRNRLLAWIWPNVAQIKLVCSCIGFLSLVTWFCYYLYGEKFLNESILYHLVRKDTRHNFSLFFYLLYLNPVQPSILLFLPQLLLLFVLSIAFHQKKDLAFCFFAECFVVVTYNPVVTSQYWIWVLSLLPTCLPQFNLQFHSVSFLSLLWTLAQVTWLVPAYLLEFRGRNTFFYIWLQGLAVFCANIAILGRLIQSYNYVKNVPGVKRE